MAAAVLVVRGAAGARTHWREASTSAARLHVATRGWLDEEPGKVKFSGFVPGGGVYRVFVTAQPPGRTCPRYPPDAALDEGAFASQDEFKGSLDPWTRAGAPVAGTAIRACGYLVRSRSERTIRTPIVVARAEAVGTPRKDVRTLIGAIVLCVLLVGGIAIGAKVLGSSRRAATRTRRGRAPSQPATRRCVHHNNKVEYATEAEAQRFVDWTRRRDARGLWRGQPMDHCYECPAVGGHWHVTKKPRRSR